MILPRLNEARAMFALVSLSINANNFSLEFIISKKVFVYNWHVHQSPKMCGHSAPDAKGGIGLRLVCKIVDYFHLFIYSFMCCFFSLISRRINW